MAPITAAHPDHKSLPPAAIPCALLQCAAGAILSTKATCMDAWAVEPDAERARILKTMAWALGHLEGDVKRNLETMDRQIVVFIERRDATPEGVERDRLTTKIGELQKARAAYDDEIGGGYRDVVAQCRSELAAHDARAVPQAAE